MARCSGGEEGTGSSRSRWGSSGELLVLALRFTTCSPLTSPPAYSSAAAGDVISYNFPALDDGQPGDDGLVVATRSFSLSPASFLFDALIFPAFNSSKGFVLLSQPVQLWAAATDDTDTQLIREASFNTSFTVHGVSTVAFVILLDSFPPLAGHPTGPTDNSSMLTGSSGPNASNNLAAVEVGAVTSYGLQSPDVGLNITATFNTTASGSCTVWIEYNAVAHHLSVYVAAAGETRPLQAILDASLILTSRYITQNAFVGFFAATVRDVMDGVRNWELILDKFPGTGGGNVEDSRMATPFLLILLVVLGSLAAMVCIVSVVVCFCISRRREELKMEHIMKQSYPHPTRRTVGT
ncbi:hypothetical protein BAE44_0007351 [Dichanthelium oligosanthes]|uniref:Legume lectin domain-containing protein n=1 Tax=Dichanthelium oligosanthes TaxID=888268 RepID=A0A1E5W2P6_9POAL|nr:hypothetical protein BAE44_0007351 [Dichanthelium oligosanthes]